MNIRYINICFKFFLKAIKPINDNKVKQKFKIDSYLRLGDSFFAIQKYDLSLNQYLNVLNSNLKELNNNTYDFVFYVAGVDIHHEDRLGKLKITDEGINKRDRIVIENFYSKKTPLCGVLGGGYNKSFDKLIELHSMLHKNCAEYF